MRYSVKILFEYQISEKELEEYKLIDVPSSAHIAPESVERLARFMENGGRVLVDGPSAHFFQKLGGYQCAITPEQQLLYIEAEGKLGIASSAKVDFKTTEATLVNKLHGSNLGDANPMPAYLHRPIGNGHLAVLAFSLSFIYKLAKTETMRAFLREIIEGPLGFKPAIQVTGSTFVQNVVLQKEDKLLVNLINMSGDHAVKEIHQFEEIPPIGPITVTIAPEIPFKTATLVPSDQLLQPIVLPDGSRQITLPSLAIHAIVVLE